MLSPELIRETLDTANLECWERERKVTPVRAFAVRLHATGYLFIETQAILRLFVYIALIRRSFSGYIT